MNAANALTEAIQIVTEMEQDELASLKAKRDVQDTPEHFSPDDDGGDGGGEPAASEFGPDGPGGGGDLPPSEPPVSDSAVGADSQGSMVLGLLTDIRGFLGQLASALAPEPEEGEAAGEDAPPEGSGSPIPDDEAEVPVEDPSEEAAAEEKEEGEAAEEEEEKEKPKKGKKPEFA